MERSTKCQLLINILVFVLREKKNSFGGLSLFFLNHLWGKQFVIYAQNQSRRYEMFMTMIPDADLLLKKYLYKLIYAQQN